MKFFAVAAASAAVASGTLLRQPTHLRSRAGEEVHLAEDANATAAAQAGPHVGTCPNYLETLSYAARSNASGVFPEVKVVEAPRQGNNGFGPIFETGIRYMVFDEDHTSGFIGVRCKVQSAVRCKPSGKAKSTNSSCASKPCDPDVHNPPMQYIKTQLGGAVAGLVASSGKAAPANVVSVGVGGGSMPTWLLDAFPTATVHAVDSDAAVLKTAVECFGLPGQDARLKQHVQDGMNFFSSKGAYDLVVLDMAPMTAEFREGLPSIQKSLVPGGVMSANGPAHDEEWQKFKVEAKNDFASVWISGDALGNEVIVAVSVGGGENVAKIANTPTKEELTAGGAPKDAATWFTFAHWAKV